MSPTVALVHYLTMHRKEVWTQVAVREWARSALHERDALVLRVAELEKRVKDTPKFQGMTELA